MVGKLLVKVEDGVRLVGRVVETEAYFGPGDPASHAHRGPTPRSRIMWEHPGTAYVYFCYGMHYLFNVVTESKGEAGAVLIRAVEPLEGIDVMKQRRQTDNLYRLCSGPARLTQAFGINLEYNGVLLSPDNGIYFASDDYKTVKIIRSHRVGVPPVEGDSFRFMLAGSKFISKG